MFTRHQCEICGADFRRQAAGIKFRLCTKCEHAIGDPRSPRPRPSKATLDAIGETAFQLGCLIAAAHLFLGAPGLNLRARTFDGMIRDVEQWAKQQATKKKRPARTPRRKAKRPRQD